MRKYIAPLVTSLMLSSGLAMGKLPAPTLEEQKVAETRKVLEEEQLKKEKVLLDRAQDRIAGRYGNGNRGRAMGAQTSAQNMPKTTSELPRGVGPTPTRPQSAEAHSGSAK